MILPRRYVIFCGKRGQPQTAPFKDTHCENTPSNKTEALTKRMNIYVWAIGKLNQLFISDTYTQIKFSKK